MGGRYSLDLRERIIGLVENGGSFDALWRAIGDICGLFDPQECWDFLKTQDVRPIKWTTL